MATREREKKANREKTRDKRPMAEAKYIRIPSSKAEIVLDLIRGKMYAEAAAILTNTNKSACAPILKVLNSAAANGENNSNMPKDELYVAECYACSGPTLKRMMPRARGRADRILKRTCHITIILDEKAGAAKSAAKKPVANTQTKAVKKEGGVTMKKETVKPARVAVSKPLQKSSTEQKKNTTSAKEQPDIRAERPLTNQPNNKKPLGTKKETDMPGAAKQPSSKPAASTTQGVKKPAVKKETK